ncbi:MAG: peptide deformylase [Planctomycetota bacterium]|jgi:peptide deformylase
MTIPDPDRLRILHYPAPVLTGRAESVRTVDDEVRALAQRMIELMHEAEGAGLAAPQVGVPWRMFVTSPQGGEDRDRVYVNPVLAVDRGELVTAEEGCLSLPGIYVDVRRPSAATITALDLDGAERTEQAEGFRARVWQHEHDHLDGVLIIDRMTPMSRIATRKALKELRAAAETA